MEDLSAKTAAAISGLGLALAWVIGSLAYSYFAESELSPVGTLIGALVAGVVFGALSYTYGGGRRR